MSHFEAAIETVLAHEGGFTDGTGDSGGATQWGISLRWLRTLGHLDHDGEEEGDLDHDGDVDADDVRRLTRAQAIAFYRKGWWDRGGYQAIEPQALATKLLDLAVNIGATAAHRCLQRALRAVGTLVEEDGILGPVTKAAVNAVEHPECLLAAFRSEAAGYYRALNRPEYQRGWLSRAYF